MLLISTYLVVCFASYADYLLWLVCCLLLFDCDLLSISPYVVNFGLFAYMGFYHWLIFFS